MEIKLNSQSSSSLDCGEARTYLISHSLVRDNLDILPPTYNVHFEK